jgi:hypothetical protein
VDTDVTESRDNNKVHAPLCLTTHRPLLTACCPPSTRTPQSPLPVTRVWQRKSKSSIKTHKFRTMSRRTKLLITALFLVLLAIPVWHLVDTWHPPSPLRFRHVGERLDEKEHVLAMEVQNTSHATVMFLVGSFYENDDSRIEEPAFTSAWGRKLDEAVFIPPGGSVEILFHGLSDLSDLSPRTKMDLQAGTWLPRQGHFIYGWSSRPHAQHMRAMEWIHNRIPASWVESMPVPSIFFDTVDLDAPVQDKGVPIAGGAR